MPINTREFAVGEKVIITYISQVMGLWPMVYTVEKINPKSIVVDGKRFAKDSLECRDGSGWGSKTYTLVPMDSPEAPRLLALRKLLRAKEAYGKAANNIGRTSITIAKAMELRTLLGKYVVAQRAFDEFETPKES